MMADSDVTEIDTERARHCWAAYQLQHDVSDRMGQVAGIDPVSGRIWFGASAQAIVAQLDTEGVRLPLYFVRVGADYYLRKGGQR